MRNGYEQMYRPATTLTLIVTQIVTLITILTRILPASRNHITAVTTPHHSVGSKKV